MAMLATLSFVSCNKDGDKPYHTMQMKLRTDIN